ncbi:hypothetical protein [Paenibacillus taichungensis]
MFSQNQLSETPVVVVDEDHSSYSRQLIEEFDASQYMKLTSQMCFPIASLRIRCWRTRRQWQSFSCRTD